MTQLLAVKRGRGNWRLFADRMVTNGSDSWMVGKGLVFSRTVAAVFCGELPTIHKMARTIHLSLRELPKMGVMELSEIADDLGDGTYAGCLLRVGKRLFAISPSGSLEVVDPGHHPGFSQVVAEQVVSPTERVLVYTMGHADAFLAGVLCGSYAIEPSKPIEESLYDLVADKYPAAVSREYDEF